MPPTRKRRALAPSKPPNPKQRAAPTRNPPASTPTTKRARVRKRKHDPSRGARSKETTKPLAAPEYHYLALRPVPAPPAALDAPTLRMHLDAALTQHLGDTGAAIPVDILALQPEAVVRVPGGDAAAVAVALAGWAGARGAAVEGFVVAARGDWLADVVGPRRAGGEVEGGGGGGGLFDFAAGVDDSMRGEGDGEEGMVVDGGDAENGEVDDGEDDNGKDDESMGDEEEDDEHAAADAEP